jgi:hypothetical protein
LCLPAYAFQFFLQVVQLKGLLEPVDAEPAHVGGITQLCQHFVQRAIRDSVEAKVVGKSKAW